MDHVVPDPVTRFAGYVAILGRGPGRSRALTRPEARDALALVLADAVHLAQLGAFLMLLRYRGEDPDEISGLVDAIRDHLRASNALLLASVDLDWPSYGAGRTRGAPWFLLSALALARSGVRVLMHGTNEFSGGIGVPEALLALGLHPAGGTAEAAALLDHAGFCYWPAAVFCPPLHHLLGLRRLFGLRSPLNTVARLLDPGNAGVSVDGVFHPPYIALHLAAAERLGRRGLAVVKGGGGEAERSAFKPTTAHLWRAGAPARERVLPALHPAARDPAGPPDTPEALARLWRGEDDGPAGAAATVVATIALALLALDPDADPDAADRHAAAIWAARHSPSPSPFPSALTPP